MEKHKLTNEETLYRKGEDEMLKREIEIRARNDKRQERTKEE